MPTSGPRKLRLTRPARPIFVDPPTQSQSGGPTMVDVLKPVQDRPGEWAIVIGPVPQKTAYNTAQNIRYGGYAGVPKHHFKTKVAMHRGSWHVWARYDGAPVPAETTA